MSPVPATPSLGFNYIALPEVAASYLREAADRIRGVLRKNIIEIGNELINARTRLEHGQFGGWLAAEFEMTERTAENYMNAARLAAGQSEIVSVLQATALYLLAAPSTPEAVQTAVLEKVKIGKPPPVTAIKAMVAKAKREELAAGEAKLSPAAKRRRARHKAKEAERQRQREEAEALADNAAADIVAILRTQLAPDVLDHIADLAAKLDWRHTLTSIVKAALAKAAA